MSDLGLENSDQTLQEREEDLEDGGDLDTEELLAAMAENSSDQFSEVPPEEIEDEELLLDDTLSPLEKIFLYVKSDLVFHRVFIAKELPSLIKDVEISEAVEYVLPLMNSLGTDPEDHVREAFVPELDKIIWFYYSHCPLREIPTEITTDNIQSDNNSTSRPLTPQRPQTPQSPQIPQRPQTPIQQSLPSQPPTPTNHLPYLSPAAFTPLLHALLLDQNTGIAQVAQNVIQSLVERILEEPDVNPKEKELLEKETLEGVVLGIGRLDQEKVKREELNEWEADCDDTSVGAVTGIEEEVELGRMTMMSLISSLAPIVGPERCIRLFVPELDKMMEEPVFYVRKEAALAIGSLANVLPLDIITSKLLPIYDHFSTDPIWHVRRSCCLVLPTLCSKLPDEMKSDRAVKGIEIFAGDVSRSVRSAAGEIIGELIATFQPDGKVPESLVHHFLSLGPVRENNLSNGVTSGTYNNNPGQRDPERPVICAFNFPAVVLTLGESSWDDLKDTYIPLTRDMQIKVRRSLACSLHEIAKVIGPTKTENDLLNVFTYYLDDIDEVKSGIIEHLAAFIECLPQSTRNNYLPSLNDVWDGVKNHWRLRDEITKQIPALCRLFDEQYVLNHILPLTIRAVKDEVASVRETAVASFPALFEVIRNDESCFHDMINRVCNFVSDSGFRGRVIYVQICNALISTEFSKADFEKYFLHGLEKLSSDNVVNVRIALGRIVGELCQLEQYYQDPATRPSQITYLINKLAEDLDFDVRSFVFPLLSPEERSKFISSTIQAMAESVENGMLHINEESNQLEVVKPKSQGSVETAPLNSSLSDISNSTEMNHELQVVENGHNSSRVIMGEIPIAFIRPNNVIDVDNNNNNNNNNHNNISTQNLIASTSPT